MFYQVEGLAVGKRITMTDLKGVMAEFARQMPDLAAVLEKNVEDLMLGKTGIDLDAVRLIDFDDGGRFYAQMTDRDPEKIELEMPVELTFRWMHSERGIRNYYWKCRPLRGA